ncbi:MAG TPA: ATP-binding cassette domain-containing protein, partial [Bdellovibrio sp.]|nr:ATP-binding cassette domain-containing protein [Bdellovibrio sp.]
QQETEKLEEAHALLAQFGLQEKAHRHPRQLSGGEQQRIAIARALLMKPQYLFADEPTGSLDSANAKNVMNILMNVNRTQGTTVVLVTHDQDSAAMANRQIQLADGKVI